MALVDGEIAFRQHSGGHTDGPNWPTLIEFAARYIETPREDTPGTDSRRPGANPEANVTDATYSSGTIGLRVMKTHAVLTDLRVAEGNRSLALLFGPLQRTRPEPCITPF